MINGIEIFSGAGGLAKGLEMAGIQHRCLIERNEDACTTLRMNFPSKIVNEADIRSFDFTQLDSIDFIAGGPPCQPFSLGGKAKGNEDERDMFPEAIRTIRELKPKVFVFENVKGLLRQSFRDYFNYIILQLQYPDIFQNHQGWREHYAQILKEAEHHISSSLSYSVSYSLVNAADFGIPQKRERVLIVGIRNDLNKNWVFPPKTHSLDALLWSKFVTHEYWEKLNISPSNGEFSTFREMSKRLQDKYGMFPPELLPWQTVRNAFQDMPQTESQAYFSEEHIIREGAKEYPGHTGSPIDEPSKTLKAGAHGVPGGENMVKLPDGSVRYYTVFEAKRIQTFPDQYHVYGSWTEAMRQIGNAVPIKLAQLVGDSIMQTILK